MPFRDIQYLGQYSARSQIRENMIWRLREAFTNIGAYYNISPGTSTTDCTTVLPCQISPGLNKQICCKSPDFMITRVFL
jgi:hypothetical protein